MATAARIPEPLTYDDFCTLVQDGQKADLIDGIIFMASPDNTDANDLNGWLYFIIRGFVDRFQLGKTFISRVACKLDEHNAPEPDIIFVSKRQIRKVLRGRVDGPPGVAIEFVSPGSVDLDYHRKRIQYEKFAVIEYWIIDEVKRKATFLRLGADGKYKEVQPRAGVFRNQVMEGFWLPLKWLWPETRPVCVDALAELIESRKNKRGRKNGA